MLTLNFSNRTSLLYCGTSLLCYCPLSCVAIEQIIGKWEKSGNGFGQRSEKDKHFGHFDPQQLTLEQGDNRANFVNRDDGHRAHHLYFWHLADVVGCLTSVLNVMSPEVSANCANVATNTAAVQKTHRQKSAEQVQEARKKEKKLEAFRIGVVASMSSMSISYMMEALQKEEDNIRNFRLALLKPTISPQEKELYEELVDHHINKAQKMEEEIGTMRVGSSAILSMFRNDDNDKNDNDKNEDDEE